MKWEIENKTGTTRKVGCHSALAGSVGHSAVPLLVGIEKPLWAPDSLGSHFIQGLVKTNSIMF